MVLEIWMDGVCYGGVTWQYVSVGTKSATVPPNFNAWDVEAIWTWGAPLQLISSNRPRNRRCVVQRFCPFLGEPVVWERLGVGWWVGVAMGSGGQESPAKICCVSALTSLLFLVCTQVQWPAWHSRDRSPCQGWVVRGKEWGVWCDLSGVTHGVVGCRGEGWSVSVRTQAVFNCIELISTFGDNPVLGM